MVLETSIIFVSVIKKNSDIDVLRKIVNFLKDIKTFFKYAVQQL